MGWGQVGNKRGDPWCGRPTRYARRQTTVGLSPFTYPLLLLTLKMLSGHAPPTYAPHTTCGSPPMLTPASAIAPVPATQPPTSSTPDVESNGPTSIRSTQQKVEIPNARWTMPNEGSIERTWARISPRLHCLAYKSEVEVDLSHFDSVRTTSTSPRMQERAGVLAFQCCCRLLHLHVYSSNIIYCSLP